MVRNHWSRYIEENNLKKKKNPALWVVDSGNAARLPAGQLSEETELTIFSGGFHADKNKLGKGPWEKI